MTPKVPDQGHREADKELHALARRLHISYRQARIDLQEKIEEYLEQFEKQDAEKRALYDSGEMSHEAFLKWRETMITDTEHWRNMLDQLAMDMTNQNKIAASMIDDTLPDVYAINHNYGTYEAEAGSGFDTTYTLYDKYTVARLVKEQQVLLPKPRVPIAKDLQWNKQHIQSAVLQGILQGESMSGIAERLLSVTTMTESAALRNARTAVTGAENAGRIDSYIRAQNMGIKLKQVWMSTLDDRTRDSHAMIDGETQEVGKKFSNGCRYPGDPEGAPAEVYNCRCTIVADVEGAQPYDMGARPSKYLRDQGLTYDKWKEIHGDRFYSKLFKNYEEPEIPEKPILPPFTPIKNVKTFETNKSVDEYFRGSTYNSKLGGANKLRGYGITSDETKPATKWANKLTFDQSQAVTDYTGDQYEPINNYLRGIWDKKEAEENYTGNLTLSKNIKYLDSAIKKFNLPEPITVYRTCDREFLDSLKVGSIFHDDGYGSTSMLSIPVASGDVHMSISVPKGKGIGAYVDGLSWKEGEEFEFLLARGADYYVESIEERKDGVYVKATITGFTPKD